jgi:transcriptional regulator of acetoin/glycerol metabolism
MIETTKSRKAEQQQGDVFAGQSTSHARPEPDLVTAIFDLLCESGGIAPHAREEHEDAVRHQLLGLRGTVTNRPNSAAMARKALALFNGRNAREVARRLGISRPHVYRLLKQPGGSV